MKYSTNLDNYEEGVFKKKSPSSLFRLPLLDNFSIFFFVIENKCPEKI